MASNLSECMILLEKLKSWKSLWWGMFCKTAPILGQSFFCKESICKHVHMVY